MHPYDSRGSWDSCRTNIFPVDVRTLVGSLAFAPLARSVESILGVDCALSLVCQAFLYGLCSKACKGHMDRPRTLEIPGTCGVQLREL